MIFQENKDYPISSVCFLGCRFHASNRNENIFERSQKKDFGKIMIIKSYNKNDNKAS